MQNVINAPFAKHPFSHMTIVLCAQEMNYYSPIRRLMYMNCSLTLWKYVSPFVKCNTCISRELPRVYFCQQLDLLADLPESLTPAKMQLPPSCMVANFLGFVSACTNSLPICPVMILLLILKTKVNLFGWQ